MRSLELYPPREEHFSLVFFNSVRDIDVLKSNNEESNFRLMVHLLFFKEF